MGKRIGTGAIALLMAAALLALAPAVAGADATDLLASWQMNEGTGASVMVDSSGNGIDGAIGDAVLTGQSVDGATAYTWTNTQPNQPPPKPERLILVDDDRLNPGDDDFAVTVRFRTSRPFGNIIQKGQSNNLGGNWKWQIPSGKLVCVFSGIDETGNEVQKSVNSGDAALGFAPLDDGEWHVARCERRGDQLILTIDAGTPDQRVRRANGPTGNISNNVPMTIGGKLNCDQVNTTCDYFVGNIDYVLIETSPRDEPNVPPVAVASAECGFLDCDFSSSGSFDPDGFIAGYSWDFGDGDGATGPAPSHTYDEPGTYQARLTVTDNGGSTDGDTIFLTVSSEPPIAAFTSTCDFRECSFDAAGSADPDGTIVSYEWSFGDGDTGTGVAPSHTYTNPDTYEVTLTVTDNHGETDDSTGDVTATNQDPVASFDGECNYQTCSFDAGASNDPDGAIVGYSWDFGDGATGTGVAPEHIYSGPGSYNVTLTVTDNHDGTDEAGAQVVPTEAPVVHLHDLMANPYDLDGDKWVARVVVKVRDGEGTPVGGVEITAVFGAGKVRTCTTNAAGKCKVKVKIRDSRPKIPVEVTNVEWPGGYDSAANRDKDGDGNGETTKVWRPELL